MMGVTLHAMVLLKVISRMMLFTCKKSDLCDHVPNQKAHNIIGMILWHHKIILIFSLTLTELVLFYDCKHIGSFGYRAPLWSLWMTAFIFSMNQSEKEIYQESLINVLVGEWITPFSTDFITKKLKILYALTLLALVIMFPENNGGHTSLTVLSKVRISLNVFTHIESHF